MGFTVAGCPILRSTSRRVGTKNPGAPSSTRGLIVRQGGVIVCASKQPFFGAPPSSDSPCPASEARDLEHGDRKKDERHLDRSGGRASSSVAQWRDPCISSLPLLVLAVAPLLVIPEGDLLLFLLLLVLAVILTMRVRRGRTPLPFTPPIPRAPFCQSRKDPPSDADTLPKSA
jgi:hypothetical protein